MKILQFITLIFVCFSKIFALQFGFTIRDDKNSVKEKFLAFGIIPNDTSAKIQAEICDQLTAFINEELHRRRLEGIDRNSFVSEPEMLSILNDGRVVFGLKGESSVFLNLFRMSCKYILPIKNIWKNSIFFYDPIVILNFDESNDFTKEIELVLINPVIVEEDESIYADIFKNFNSSNSSNSSFDDDDESSISEECCRRSCCNLM